MESKIPSKITISALSILLLAGVQQAVSAELKGDKNYCNVVTSGNNQKIILNCNSVPSAVVAQIEAQLTDLQLSTNQIREIANGLAEKFHETNESLKTLPKNDPAVKSALAALEKGQLGLAETIVARFDRLEPKLGEIKCMQEHVPRLFATLEALNSAKSQLNSQKAKVMDAAVELALHAREKVGPPPTEKDARQLLKSTVALRVLMRQLPGKVRSSIDSDAIHQLEAIANFNFDSVATNLPTGKRNIVLIDKVDKLADEAIRVIDKQIAKIGAISVQKGVCSEWH